MIAPFQMPRCFTSGLRLLPLLLLPSLAVANAQLVNPAPARTLGPAVGQTPPHVLNGTAVAVEHYESGKMLRLAFALKPPHPVEEAAFLDDVQNKNSPNFHQFLSAEEWNTRFGPSAADEQAVVEWARSQGLTITHRYGNRLVVDVEATAGTIEKALSVTLNNYSEMLPDGTLSAAKFSNDRDPLLPSPVSEIVESVQGLNSFESVRPSGQFGPQTARPDYVPGPVEGRHETAQADAAPTNQAIMLHPDAPVTEGTPVVTSAPTNGYQPIELYDAGGYDLQALQALGHCCNPLGNPSNSPKESSIAIAAFADVNFNDIAGFHNGFPYLAYNIEKIPVDGAYTCGTNDNGCGEVTMDTEWALTFGNSFGSVATTSKLFVYEGANYNNATVIDLYTKILDDNLTRVISTSWGCGENQPYATSGDCYNSTMKARDNVLSSLAGQGWTIIAGSGDEGATALFCAGSLGVFFPASDPNVVAAGGTTLYVNTGNLGFSSEVAWSGGTSTGSCGANQGGSTGGFSSYWGVPGYQSGMGFKSRGVPDLSLNASVGQDTYFNGGWGHPGGTSIVGPELAGFFAQENAYLLSLGNVCNNNTACAPIGNPNYAIYNQGNHPNGAHNPFYDITSGCNSNDVTIAYKLTAYCAGKGYDNVTGWGSVNMLQLAWALNWETLPANGIPYTTFTGPTVDKWYNTNQNVNFTIQDYAGTTGGKATGIAGYTVAWDSIPTDPTTEATPAAYLTVNSFYSGPQFPNVKTGCIGEAQGTSCYGFFSAAGCHTAHVRGWNNMGWTTGDSTYGPVCFDNVAPTIAIGVAQTVSTYGWYTGNATVSLTATDANSGVAAIYYSVNQAACAASNTAACKLYTAAFVVSGQGHNIVYSFSKDNAGNFSAVEELALNLDDVAPVTTIAVGGTKAGAEYVGTVTFTLSATDATSGIRGTYIAFDTNAYQLYTTPVQFSTPGTHTVSYYSLDDAGNFEASHLLAFTVQATTVTSLVVNPNPASSTQPITLTAYVAANIATNPTGSVIFYVDGQVVGTQVLTYGTAQLTGIQLTAGSHILSASYSGATQFGGSSSAPMTVQVTGPGAVPSTTTLTSSANPSLEGAPVVFTIKVSGNSPAGLVPTGPVTIFVNGIQAGQGNLDNTGSLIFNTGTMLTSGSYTFMAHYNGDTGFHPSTSAPMVQVVQ